jgi:two-component system, chemotaxis family, response regulator WspF
MKIGIVNDLAIAAEALRRALASRPEHQIIWVACNGLEAVEFCARQLPDLVLMDLLMPEMDGVEATRRIMAETPCAILIVTVSVGANAWRTFEAMGHGALDAVDTPTLDHVDANGSTKVLLAKIDIICKLISDRNTRPTQAARFSAAPCAENGNRLLAIGASAGGPMALSIVLSGLPQDFPAAVVIVQHVDEQFASGMADWLDQRSRMPVRIAREGDTLEVGTVLLASTKNHLVLKASDRLGYTTNPAECIYRPSVDVFFDSVNRFWPSGAVGVLLTGMGSDGALGLKALRRKGYHTIAQDQATSAVYGMPKAAAALDAAVDVLPLDRIAPRLVTLFRPESNQPRRRNYE